MTEPTQKLIELNNFAAAEKAFAEAFVEDPHTETGVAMVEYVPQDYPRSNVVFAAEGVDALQGRVTALNLSLLDSLPIVRGSFLAGGYVSDLLFNAGNGDPNDVDVFFNGKESFERMFDLLIAKGFTANDPNTTRFMDSERKLIWNEEFENVPYVQLSPPVGVAFRGKTVQLVKIRWYDNVEHVIDSFDFTVVQAGIDLSEGMMFFNPLGALDYSCRRIVQHRVESRSRVMMRLAKYESKGFLPTPQFTIPENAEPVKVTFA